MISNKKILSLGVVFSGLALIFILYLLIFNMLNIWPHRFHSDAAASILVNNEARHEDSFVPQDWYYKDGDLFHYSLLAAPFVDKESFSFSSHLASEFFGLIILMACLIVFSVTFFDKLPTRLTFISIVICGLSLQNAEYLLFQQAYILILSLMLLVSVLAYSLLIFTENDKWQIKKLLLFSLAIASLVFINPMRSVVTVFPLTITVIIFWILWRKQGQFLKILVTLLLSFIFGSSINFLYAFNKNISYNVTSFNIAFEEIPSRLILYLKLFVDYLGIYPIQGSVDMLAILGTVFLILFLTGGFLLFFKRKYYYSNIGFREQKIYVASTALEYLKWLFISSFITSFVLMILMKRLLIDVSSIRYQIVSIVLLFAWLVAEYEFALERYNQFFNNFFRIFFSVTFVVIAFNAYIPSNLVNYKKPPEKKHIAQILEANNIKIAYGTYWNSSVITVLSSAKVHVLPISLRPVVEQLKHLSSDRLWRNKSLFKESALVLTKAEYDYLDLVSGNFNIAFSKLKKTVTVNDKYYIAIYDENIARYIIPPSQSGSIEKIYGKFEFQNCQDRAIDVVGKSSIEVPLKLHNYSKDVVFSSAIEHPFNIGVSLLDANGETLKRDFASISFYRNVLPDEYIGIRASIDNMPKKPGKYYLRFALVRGGIKWYLNDDGPVETLAISVP